MCLLIHQPKGVTFSRAEIADFCDYNPDGFGIMYGDGRELLTLKMLGNSQAIYRNYLHHAAGRECALHFRMATHGDVTEANVHPFMVTDRIAMMHNGILDIGNPMRKEWTDSEHLVEYFIRPIALHDPDLIFHPTWGEMLGEMIGASNRLVFAHADGRFAVINEAQGVTHKRAWLSNTYAWSSPDKWKKYAIGGRGYSITTPYTSPKMADGKKEEAGEEIVDASSMPLEWKAELDLDMAAAEWFGGDEEKLCRWMLANRDASANILIQYYNGSHAEMLKLLEEQPATASNLMVEIIQAERDEEAFCGTTR